MVARLPFWWHVTFICLGGMCFALPHSDVLQGFIAAIGLGVFLAGVAWTIVVPDLGPQDRLARTVVVPS